MKNRTKKGLIYARVSSPKQDDGLSKESQIDLNTKLCLRCQLEIDRVVDETFPAKTMERPKMSKILKEIREGTNTFDVIIVSSFDRFSRNALTALEVAELFRSKNIELWTLYKRYNLYTPKGQIEFLKDAAAAEEENLNRSARAIESINIRVKRGESPNNVPYGYKKLRRIKLPNSTKFEPAVVVFDEPASTIIKEGFMMVARGAYSGEAAYRKCKEMGYHRQLKTFYSNLHNPYYTGYSYYTEEDGVTKTLQKGNHPPLISEETFRLVQIALSKDSKEVTLHKKRRPLYPFRGILSCPKCGRKLTAAPSRSRNGEQYHYYMCPNKGTKCKINIPMVKIDEGFTRLFNSFNFSKEVQKVYRAILKDQFKLNDAKRDNRLKEIEMQRTTFVNEKMELTRSFTIKKEIGKEEYDLVINQINLDSELMNSEYEELLKIESEFTVYIRTNNPMLTNFNSFFWNSDLDTKFELLRILFPEKIILKDTYISNQSLNEKFRLLSEPSFKLKTPNEESSDIQQSVD